MEWTQFWEQFKQAVHDNPDVTNPNKLAYLRDAIRDPETRNLLYCSNETDGYYDEMVAVLHSRFDQGRVIHAAHCRTLADLQLAKSTKADLTRLADTIYKAVSGLRRTGQFEAAPFATSLAMAALPKNIKEDWEEKTEMTKKVPDVVELIDFIRRKAKTMVTTLTTTPPPEIKKEPKPHHRRDRQQQRPKAVVNASTTPLPPQPPVQSRPISNQSTPPSQSYQGYRYSCVLCSDHHPLFMCHRFNTMTIAQRKEHMNNHQLCFNCFALGHKTVDCRSLARCKTCQDKHHTMVHQDRNTQSSPQPVASTNSIASKLPPTIQSSLTMTSQVMLEGPTGRKMVVRALLDSGSTISLLSTKAANTLKLPKTATHITFSGVQDSVSTPSHALVNVAMSSLQATDTQFQISAAVVPRVTCDLPLQGAAGVKDLPHLKDLELADPNFYLPGRIDLLLGENILSRLLRPDVRVGPEGIPIAWKTVFGWTIHGPFTPDSTSTIQAATHVTIFTVVESIEKALTRFWEAEEPPTMEAALTPEEVQVQQHYLDHHLFLLDTGRYQVTLPRKPDTPSLGESRSQALQCCTANERSLLRKGTWEKFQAVIQEYLDLCHAQLVPPSDLSTTIESYYLLMHGVVKEVAPPSNSVSCSTQAHELQPMCHLMMYLCRSYSTS